MTDKHHNSQLLAIFLLLFLVIAGLILHYIDALEWRQVLEWAREYTQYWWLAPVLVGLQIVFFMFALPGSLFLWVATLLYPPVSATIILVAGSTLGGLAAYLISRTLATPWKKRIQQNQIFHTLQARGDFITLLALRIMPGFPHSVINYSSGILHLPISSF
ncbi:MAG: TVP38/TMEM64 family protein, partial [Gammaproteobacteria bacterium]|nr:TVP38/TMEM64 family protein [Gammaproteobacteria bacterium]